MKGGIKNMNKKSIYIYTFADKDDYGDEIVLAMKTTPVVTYAKQLKTLVYHCITLKGICKIPYESYTITKAIHHKVSEQEYKRILDDCLEEEN